MNTTWTFASGLQIPVTFEVLENCSADVIIGEEVLWEHDVFRSHAAAIYEKPYKNEEDELLDLAPFSYMGKWQQKSSYFKHKLLSKFNSESPNPNQHHSNYLHNQNGPTEQIPSRTRHSRTTKPKSGTAATTGITNTASKAKTPAQQRKKPKPDGKDATMPGLKPSDDVLPVRVPPHL